MTDPRETDRLPPGLVRALRDLPRERAAPGFTRRVLAGIDRRPASALRTALDPGGARSHRLRLAAASAVTALVLAGAVALALTLSTPRRERASEPERAVRLRTLAAERDRLADELAEIRRLSREPLPVVYLGGDESVDLVVDPQVLSELARRGRNENPRPERNDR